MRHTYNLQHRWVQLSGEAQAFHDRVRKHPFAQYESFGIRDPRITEIDGIYYITFVADSESGQRIGLARTSDFQSAERMHLISESDTKSGALFPRKIGGRYAMLERPSAGGSIWISYSDDLTYWGASTVVMTPRGGHMDSTRIGAACPPTEIDQGWLLVYYGEKGTSAGPLVRLGAAILDRDDPSRMIRRSNIPILSPREKYERIGDVGNVVFSCGTLLEGDGTVKLCYGASDSCICLGTCLLDDVIRVCHESQEEY
ncbi:MAG: glycoside hydrolase family 130 protein [Planctomycetota bacterium]